MRQSLVLASGLSAFLAISHLPVQAALILHYKFNETGATAPSSGPNTTAVTMRNDAGTATDLHSADGGGVTGLAGDRSYANLGPNDHGSVASAATNGFRANHAADLNAIDQLSSFTVSGWYKTETNITLVGKTPRLVWNHNGTAGAGGAGFNLQFLSGSEDLKLDVDDDSTSVNTSGNLYADKQRWVFFAVTYDGTVAANNVKFYKGYRNSTESAAGTTHGASPGVLLMGTFSLNRGTVNTETVAMVIGNRTGGDRPFDGFIDEVQIEGVTSGNTGALTITQIEAIRLTVVPEPSGALLVSAALLALSGVRRRKQ